MGLFLKICLFVLGFLTLWNNSNAQGLDELAFETKFISLEDPDPIERVEITNEGSEDAHFSLKVNDGFFITEEEMVDEIKTMKKEAPNEPLEKLAWMYMKEKTKFSKALSPYNWQHSPTFMINSIGNGQCDDLASTLSLLWKGLGFESRVWGLEGHVVPEVFSNGRWQMYDPSHQIYFQNHKHEVAGVEELVADPMLITHPVMKAELDPDDILNSIKAHSRLISRVYASDSNNRIESLYDLQLDFENILFGLPPHAKMIFPIDHPSNGYQKKPDYSFLLVELPPSHVARLEVPLVLHSIEGIGKVIIGSIEYDLGSAQLNDYLGTFSTFHHQLNFLHTDDTTRVFYLINHRVLALGQKTELAFQGDHLDGISANISFDKNVPKGTHPLNIDSILRIRITEYQKSRSKYDQGLSLENSTLTFHEKLLARANFYIDSDKSLDKQQKIDKKVEFRKKIELFLGNVSEDSRPKKLKSAMEEPALFIVFYTYVEFHDIQDFLELMR